MTAIDSQIGPVPLPAAGRAPAHAPSIRTADFLHKSIHPVDGARRVLIVGRIMIGIVSVILLALVARVVQLQLHPPAPIAALVDSQFSKQPLPARRGSLLDARGRPIATTRVAHSLFVDPQLIEDPGTFSEYVGYTLNYEPASIEMKIAARPHSRFIVLDERLTDDRRDLLREFRMSGLAMAPRLVRDYPQGQLASHVIGFVGADGKGLEGLEMKLDARLRGVDGSIKYLRDARRRPLWVEPHDYRPNADGESVQLCLDLTIQQIAEEELAAAVAQFKAKAGQMIVMRPATGEILAMANLPYYDPNEFAAVAPDLRRNRCVTDVYEPGSIFKPFMWAAITDAGVMKPNEKVDTTDSGYWVTPNGRRLSDVRGHGLVTWDEVLIYSSNIGMGKGGLRMSHRDLRDAMLRFGFGSPTGSGLPGEVGGKVTSPRNWSHYSQTSVTMGYEVGVTALQLLAAFGAIANDGKWVQPTIFAVDADRMPDAIAGMRRAISPAAAVHTRSVLGRVVTDGTGRKARSDLFTIYGKTGTAHVANPGRRGYLHDQYVASFLAGAPLDQPEIVVLCSVHRPDRSIGHYGGTVAAPPVKNVIERTLTYLGTPSNKPAPPGRSSMQVVHITD
jgi:cell division protein FtsI (penicillin-binding protein 3)